MKYPLLILTMAISLSACQTSNTKMKPTKALTTDHDIHAIPLSTLPAYYPQNAAINNISGFVQFVFDIEPNGSPINIKIVESKPIGVFDKEAIKALQRWKFKPKFVDGTPLLQKDMRYRMEFVLE